MKLDEFDQYIRNQYQGYEVTPPPQLETAVMGQLARAKWGKRLGGTAVVLLAATLWWANPMGPTAAEYTPVVEVLPLPTETRIAETPEAVEPIHTTTENQSVAPASNAATGTREAWHSMPQPGRLEPLSNLVDAGALNVQSEAERTLKESQGGDELWVISAEVEVKD